MTEDTGKGEAALEAADLDLVASMADAGKDEEALWAEFDNADSAEPADKQHQGAAAADFDADGGDDADGRGAAPQDIGDGEDVSGDDGKAGAESGDDAAPDIWANATQEQRDAYEAMRAEKEQLAHRAKSAEGRVPGMQRRIDQLLKIAQSQDGDGKSEKKVREELASLHEEYPDFKPVADALGTLEERQEREQAQRRAEREARRNDASAELREIVAEETGKLVSRHPDYEGFLAEHGQEFARWVEDQPRAIREAAYLNAQFIRDGNAAIQVIDAFKAHLNPTPANEPAAEQTQSQQSQPLNDKRKRQLSATATPARQGGRPTVSGIPEDGDPEAIWKAFDAQDERKAQTARF